ncbi:probable ATP-dependent RNA helicase DDX5 [Dermacentor silvarum]|uniref:probable ATP-dependent RNA helicase DDX5 n=1 Tax=Dermacentor silvarum TaxID=543639 RepID=UPI0021017F6A|nr:probable ATP-dependent RNA helicase DDX5 [Dermacentor silvarum]
MNDAAGKDGLNGMSDAAGVIELWGVPQPLQGLTGDDRVYLQQFSLPRGEGYYAGKLLVPTEKGVPESEVDLDVRAPKWKRMQLLPFRKNVYQEHFATARRSPVDVDVYRKAKGIAVEGRAVPKPVLRLYEAKFPNCMLEGIEAGKYGPPTDVQAQCWPIALKGRDFMATVLNEAAGKTLAYLLPAIRARQAPATFTALVMVPSCSCSWRRRSWPDRPTR